uniref:SWIM-type domain-containing protein n=1 Tax=Chenopodium quinoa TaxID=63459 RepID=A0A803MXQ5_CHEQI
MPPIENELIEFEDESSETDDSVEDENYKIDPNDLFDDEDEKIQSGVEQELRYDDEELFDIRATNLSLRKNTKDKSGPIAEGSRTLDDQTMEEAENLEKDEEDQELFRCESSSSKWPKYFTTYEGGYVSDQRSSDDEGSLRSSDAEEEEQQIQKRSKKVTYPTFNEKTDMSHVEFTVGLKFTSQHVLKQAIVWYSIQQHKDIIYLKNDQRKLSVGCANCDWAMTAGPEIDDPSGWQIKSLLPKHINCPRTFTNRLITDSWLVTEFMDKVLRNPMIKATEMKAEMKTKYDIVVNDRKCQRAKNKALNAVKSLMQKQYGILKPYLTELVKSNPGTTCVPKTWNGEDSQTGFEVHHRNVGHAVDLGKMTCSCRGWDLTGIPCAHAMSAILYMHHKPKDYLAKWYTASTYTATYSNLLKPVPGSIYWSHEGEGMVLPPNMF